MAEDTGSVLIRGGNSIVNAIEGARRQKLAEEREGRVEAFQRQQFEFRKEQARLQQLAAKKKQDIDTAKTAAQLLRDNNDPAVAMSFLEVAAAEQGGESLVKSPQFKRFGALIQKIAKEDKALAAAMIEASGLKGNVADAIGAFGSSKKMAEGIKEFQAIQANATKADIPSVKLPDGRTVTEAEAARISREQGGQFAADETDVSVKNILMPDQSLRAFDTKTAEGRKGLREAIKAGGTLVSTSVQGQTLGDVSPLTKDKVTAREVQNIFIATRQVNAIAARIDEQLGDQDVKTALAGGVIRGIDSIANQMTQLAGSFQEDEKKYLTEIRENGVKRFNLAERFGEQAVKSAAFRSNVINLAYAAARAEGQTARALSDKDLNAQFDKIASRSGSKKQMRAAIKEVVRNSKSNARIALKTAQDFGALKNIQLPEEFREDEARPQVSPENQAIVDSAAEVKQIEGKGTFVKFGSKWFKVE